MKPDERMTDSMLGQWGMAALARVFQLFALENGHLQLTRFI